MVLNGSEYKTILLDTNVLMEILSMEHYKDEVKTRKKIMRELAH